MKKYIVAALVMAAAVGGAIIYSDRARSNVTAGTTADQSGVLTDRMAAELFNQKYHRPVSTMLVRVTNSGNSFAKGTVNFAGEGGGAVWFAAKTSKGWELAYDGNGIIPCAVADGYRLPADLVPSCIDTKNNNGLVQR